MFVVQKQQDDGSWTVASQHTQIVDAQSQIQRFIDAGVDPARLKLGVQGSDGTITDYVDQTAQGS